jgi:hypothetical protein
VPAAAHSPVFSVAKTVNARRSLDEFLGQRTKKRVVVIFVDEHRKMLIGSSPGGLVIVVTLHSDELLEVEKDEGRFGFVLVNRDLARHSSHENSYWLNSPRQIKFQHPLSSMST